MNKENKEPQIVIVGEAHSKKLMLTAMFFSAFLENFIREKKAEKEKLLPIIEQLECLLNIAKKTCEENTGLLKEFEWDEILVEGHTGKLEAVKSRGVIKVSFAQSEFEGMETHLGKKFAEKMKAAYESYNKYYAVYEKQRHLEFEAGLKLAGKIPAAEGIIASLMSGPISIKLLAKAKKFAKEGKRMLLICNIEHARKYSKFLSELGYENKLIIYTDEKELIKIFKDVFGGIWKLCEEFNIDPEQTLNILFYVLSD